MSKPNCYQCIHRGTVPGDAHSCCKHPNVAEESKNPLAQLQAIFASVGRTDPIMLQKLNVKGNETGIRKGWFNWPWNFDPTWLETCDGFAKKEDTA